MIHFKGPLLLQLFAMLDQLLKSFSSIVKVLICPVKAFTCSLKRAFSADTCVNMLCKLCCAFSNALRSRSQRCSCKVYVFDKSVKASLNECSESSRSALKLFCMSCNACSMICSSSVIYFSHCTTRLPVVDVNVFVIVLFLGNIR